MEGAFKGFIDQIPADIHTKVETHSDENIIVFRPHCFIIGLDTYSQDYHIALPTSDPPPMRIEHKIHYYKKEKLLAFTPEIRMMCTAYAPTGRYIAMSIKKKFFQQIAREAIGKADVSFPRMENSYTSKLINLIYSFEEELKSYKESCSLMLQSISTQIVIEILRETGNDNGFTDKGIPVNQNYIRLAVEYMLTFYNANIKIEDICKHVHLSPYYFIRMFKEKTGQSPHEFLLSIRMDKAEEMLKKGDHSIEEVARLCGFVNTTHFSNHFKKVKGIPPSEYKKIAQV